MALAYAAHKILTSQHTLCTSVSGPTLFFLMLWPLLSLAIVRRNGREDLDGRALDDLQAPKKKLGIAVPERDVVGARRSGVWAIVPDWVGGRRFGLSSHDLCAILLAVG